MKKRKYPRLSYEQIEKVIEGDAEAMIELVRLYRPYINVLSHGDKDIEDNVTTKLMKAAMQFNLDYPRQFACRPFESSTQAE